MMAEGGTLMFMGLPEKGQKKEERMIALHPSVDPRTLYASY